ncbi:aldose epimerase family protein [Bacillus daqingensis]|uniref:Aldose 1-epimerase n=1 Tax=Bacillus daqingensis TaxID=872396 RepID=A0ABV9P2J2_9BACI
MKQAVATIEGKDVFAYTIGHPDGLQVTALNYGGVITGIYADGSRNLVLSYQDPFTYSTNPDYIGALIGRTAGRIPGASVSTGGAAAELDKNDGNNNLHGGFNGFSSHFFEVEEGENELIFTTASPDGEGGFPGNLKVKVSYRVEADALHISYEASSDKATPVNMTHHSYFNFGSADIRDHRLTLPAGTYWSIDAESLPVKKMTAEGPFDFQQGQRIGDALDMEHEQLSAAGGIDHPFELDQTGPILLEDPASGMQMTVETSAPAVVIYTGNKLTGKPGEERRFMKHGAVCIETQHVPGKAEDLLVQPGEVFHEKTVFRFKKGGTAD